MLRTVGRSQLNTIFAVARSQCRESSTVSGLLGIKGLHEPQDFLRLAAEADVRCTALANAAASARGIDAICGTDELSDTICSIYDAAEFCRSVHLDPRWRASAEAACISIGGLLSNLNMHQGLYQSVAAAVGRVVSASSDRASPLRQSMANTYFQDDTCSSRVSDGLVGSEGLSPEALRTGQLLCQDFELQGVHLRGSDQCAFANATAREQQLCLQFGVNIGDPSTYPVLQLGPSEAAELGRLPQLMRRSFKRSKRALLIPTHDTVIYELLSHVDSSSLRQKAYTVAASGPVDNVAIVDGVVTVRHQMAQLLGAPSYAHYQAQRGTVAEKPEAIALFLRRLANDVRDKARDELSTLRLPGGSTGSSPVQPWDEIHLRRMLRSSHPDLPLCTITEALAALRELCSRLFQLDLIPAQPSPGELWAPDVEKLAVVDQAEGNTVGHLYLDLHARHGKVTASGVQYTIVSGRRLQDGSYQQPLAALVCNLLRNGTGCLTVSDVSTLFHEFGHVLNVLLNTTEFQHVSGTRGTSDTVEVASQLMEYFVTPNLFRGNKAGLAIANHTRSESAFAALDLQKQIFFARIDLELHGPKAPTGAAAVDLVHSIAAETLSFPPVQGAVPQARFGHLAASSGTGSKYYGYLLSKCFAAAAWQQHLSDDPFNPGAGKHIRQHLLSVGTSIAPRCIVDGLLGPGAVSEAAGGYVPCTQHLLTEIGIR